MSVSFVSLRSTKVPLESNTFIFRTVVQHHCEGEGEVAFFSAKRWDRRNRADLIESATPLRLTILAAMSEDYTTAPQYLHTVIRPLKNGCDTAVYGCKKTVIRPLKKYCKIIVSKEVCLHYVILPL